MQLRFKDKHYYDKAIEVLSSKKIESNLTKEEAFILLISDLEKEELINLCNLLSNKLNISVDDAYKIIQDGKKYELIILELALDIVLNNNYLGEKYVNKYNTSSWINHSINAALVTYNLANMLGLDSNYAFIYGLLHDYGRKYVHSFEHVIKGFEALIDMGYESESKACLIHSFINASRYCLMEVADSSFYLDENNKERFNDSSKMDDLCLILGNTNYTDYDRILNIADLMATFSGIVSSKDRIKDIITRRNNLEEAPNWKCFLVSYYNLIVYILNKLNLNNDYIEVDMDISLEKIKELLFDISDKFYNIYKEKNIVLKI